jgi:hypothetical protein
MYRKCRYLFTLISLQNNIYLVIVIQSLLAFVCTTTHFFASLVFFKSLFHGSVALTLKSSVFFPLTLPIHKNTFLHPVRSASRRLADVQTFLHGILPGFPSPTSSVPSAGWMLQPRPLISPRRPFISPARRHRLIGYHPGRSSSRRLTEIIRQWCPEKAAHFAIWTPFPLILCSKLRSSKKKLFFAFMPHGRDVICDMLIPYAS